MITIIITILIILIVLLLIKKYINNTIETLIDNTLSENFTSFNNNQSVREDCKCKKRDLLNSFLLNTQTPSSIPSCIDDYTYYVNDIYVKKEKKNNNLKDGEYCMKKPKLLYDGIYEPYIFENNGFEKVKWKITNSNIYNDFYCSDKLLEINRDMPYNVNDCEPKNDNVKLCKVADDDDVVCLSNRLD